MKSGRLGRKRLEEETDDQLDSEQCVSYSPWDLQVAIRSIQRRARNSNTDNIVWFNLGE